MKQEIIIGIIGAAVVVGLTVFYGAEYHAKNLNPLVGKDTGMVVSSTDANRAVLTLEEVSKHSSSSDCWMIISGKVYSLGSYATAHPGGSRSITSLCGKDGTVAFDTKNGRGSHSQNAVNILASYYVGDVNSKPVTTNVIPQKLPAVNEKENDD